MYVIGQNGVTRRCFGIAALYLCIWKILWLRHQKEIDEGRAKKIAVIVGKDAEIRQFTTASVARFPLAVSRKEQNGEEYVSSFIYVEAWRKNDSTSFELLKKGKNITVKGFFKPDEWTDQQGVKHNRIIMAVTDFYEPVEKEEEKAPVASKKKKAKKAA